MPFSLRRASSHEEEGSVRRTDSIEAWQGIGILIPTVGGYTEGNDIVTDTIESLVHSSGSSIPQYQT